MYQVDPQPVIFQDEFSPGRQAFSIPQFERFDNKLVRFRYMPVGERTTPAIFLQKNLPASIMKICLNGADAVSMLHKKGFTDDFQLLGNALLWVQGKVYIKNGEFTVVECHIVRKPDKRMKEFVVCGIVVPLHNSKGILISHFVSHNNL